MIDFEEIEKLAYLNQPLPAYALQAEQFAYLSMRSLYNDYRKSYIGKDQAKIERDRICLSYGRAMFDEKRIFELFKRSNEIRIKLAGYSKEVELGTCGTCQKILRIIDGREPC